MLPIWESDIIRVFATFKKVALPIPWIKDVVSDPESPWIARRSQAISLCISAVAPMSTTALSGTGDDIIIEALLFSLHMLSW